MGKHVPEVVVQTGAVALIQDNHVISEVLVQKFSESFVQFIALPWHPATGYTSDQASMGN